MKVIESFYYKIKTQDVYYSFGRIVYYKAPFPEGKSIHQIIQQRYGRTLLILFRKLENVNL